MKFRNIAYKLFLTAQWLIGIIGAISFFYYLSTGIYDINFTSKAKSCAVNIFTINEKSTIPWNQIIAENEQDLVKKYVANEINNQCSEYLKADYTEYSTIPANLYVSVNNYSKIAMNPSLLFSNLLTVLSWTLGLLLFFYIVMRWLRWLTEEKT